MRRLSLAQRFRAICGQQHPRFEGWLAELAKPGALADGEVTSDGSHSFVSLYDLAQALCIYIPGGLSFPGDPCLGLATHILIFAAWLWPGLGGGVFVLAWGLSILWPLQLFYGTYPR